MLGRNSTIELHPQLSNTVLHSRPLGGGGMTTDHAQESCCGLSCLCDRASAPNVALPNGIARYPS